MPVTTVGLSSSTAELTASGMLNLGFREQRRKARLTANEVRG